MGVITISRGCFERCCSNKKTPPYHSNLSFATLRTLRPTLLRASAYRTPSEASSRRRCGRASRFFRFLYTNNTKSLVSHLSRETYGYWVCDDSSGELLSENPFTPTVILSVLLYQEFPSHLPRETDGDWVGSDSSADHVILSLLI